MHIEFMVDGGVAYFPGLSTPRVLDSTTLESASAEKLRKLVDAACFFEQPAARSSVTKGAADYRNYTLTIVDGKRRRTLHLSDPIDDAPMQALVDYVRAHAVPPNDSTATPERL